MRATKNITAVTNNFDTRTTFYGLPKVHKVSVPLRPIVSFINSPTYNLSKFLSRILSSLLVNRYSVRNSKEFVDYVKNFTISKSEILVSFDVVSLFTSVPVDKALGLVLDLSSDQSLASRTSLDISDITIGLEHCFSSTVFSYKNSFFKQIYGTPSGGATGGTGGELSPALLYQVIFVNRPNPMRKICWWGG